MPLAYQMLDTQKEFHCLLRRFAQQVHGNGNAANATGGDVIKRNIAFLQALQHADMGKAACAATSEGDADCLMSDMTRDEVDGLCQGSLRHQFARRYLLLPTAFKEGRISR